MICLRTVSIGTGQKSAAKEVVANPAAAAESQPNPRRRLEKKADRRKGRRWPKREPPPDVSSSKGARAHKDVCVSCLRQLRSGS